MNCWLSALTSRSVFGITRQLLLTLLISSVIGCGSLTIEEEQRLGQ